MNPRWKQYLPSAQFSLVIASIALSIGLILLASWRNEETNSLVAVGEREAQAPSDRDGDGLSDWKELVYGSDPENPDTDGDGAPDAEEVALGRDLVKPGPGDEVQKAETPALAAAVAPSKNLTENLSRALLADYLSAKTAGEAERAETAERIVAQSIERTEVEAATARYTTNDLARAEGGAEALNAYADSLMRILLSRPELDFKFVLLAFGGAIESSDPAEIQNLKRYRRSYEAARDELLALPAPPTLFSLHLGFLNNTARMVASFADMEQALEDPVRGFGGFQNYQEALAENTVILVAIARELRAGGILEGTGGLDAVWKSVAGASLP